APFGSTAREAIHHRSSDVSGGNRVDTDVLRGVIQSRRFGQSDYAVLCGRVCASPFDSDDPGARGSVHDCAATLLEQQWDFILHAKKDAAKVDVQNPVPLLLFEFRYCCVSLFDT